MVASCLLVPVGGICGEMIRKKKGPAVDAGPFFYGDPFLWISSGSYRFAGKLPRYCRQ
jgi:hypothetical protein